jgi:hypothetical protein
VGRRTSAGHGCHVELSCFVARMTGRAGRRTSASSLGAVSCNAVDGREDGHQLAVVSFRGGQLLDYLVALGRACRDRQPYWEAGRIGDRRRKERRDGAEENHKTSTQTLRKKPDPLSPQPRVPTALVIYASIMNSLHKTCTYLRSKHTKAACKHGSLHQLGKLNCCNTKTMKAFTPEVRV